MIISCDLLDIVKMVSLPSSYTVVHLYAFLYYNFKFQSNHRHGFFLYASSISEKFSLQPVRLPRDDVIKWKHFPRYWSFVREFTGDRWNPRTKASDAELWCFLWSAWINSSVNNGDADDLRCHRIHYDVTVMFVGDLSYSFGVRIFIFWIASDHIEYGRCPGSKLCKSERECYTKSYV